MRPALLIIDVQNGIDESEHWGGNRNNTAAEELIRKILAFWRERRFPVYIVQHRSDSPFSPFRPDYYGHELKEFVQPKGDERLIMKRHTNAFLDTDLNDQLRQDGIAELVVCGFVTNNSVEATTRMAGELGFKVTVVSDATATFNKRGINGIVYTSDLIHQISLANLQGEYADVRTTQEVMQQFDFIDDQSRPTIQ